MILVYSYLKYRPEKYNRNDNSNFVFFNEEKKNGYCAYTAQFKQIDPK